MPAERLSRIFLCPEFYPSTVTTAVTASPRISRVACARDYRRGTSELDARVSPPLSNIDPFDAGLTEQESEAGFSRVQEGTRGKRRREVLQGRIERRAAAFPLG